MRYTRTLQSWYNAHVGGLRTGIEYDDWGQQASIGCVVFLALKRRTGV
jgi:hypothetical protein